MGKDWDNPDYFPLRDRGERLTGSGNPTASRGFANGVTFDASKKAREAFISFMTEVMAECLRVLKPGGHALVWALPRTSHWTATAIEDAGFEIRDVLTHLFGSGFPKSMDISKAIDKMQGAEREVIGPSQRHSGKSTAFPKRPGERTCEESGRKTPQSPERAVITAPSTPEARQHAGTGTALKPANEHWILARKPLSEKSIAGNVLKWGTGGLNIDACRVDAPEGLTNGGRCVGESPLPMNKAKGYKETRERSPEHPQGRFPSNLLLSHSWLCTDELCDEQCPIRLLDERSGNRPSSGRYGESGSGKPTGLFGMGSTRQQTYFDQGGASRYFTQFSPQDEVPIPFLYQSKASRAERNRGCEGLPEVERKPYEGGMHSLSDKRMNHEQNRLPASNHHPTVKPLALCKWLIRLICREGGVVLDPFCGSGSILISAIYEHCHYIGIEQEASYVEIARARVAHAFGEVAP